MRRTSRFSRAACLTFFVAALVARGASTTPAVAGVQRCSDSFHIDLAGMEPANLGQDADERIEQLRDWLWPLLLARLEATTRLEGLLAGSVTRPLMRDDALAHVLDLPVGSTRAGIAKDGTVVVMVQDAAEDALQEAVLEAIDQEMLHLARAPRQAIVYRYAIDEREGDAEMCRLGGFDARWIESRSQGFRRASLRTADDLTSFLDGGVDLLSAQCTKQGLAVTGRTRPRARLAPITAEHVASLAPPPPVTSYVPVQELGGFPELSPEQRDWYWGVADKLRTATVEDLKAAKSHLARETWNMLAQVHAWQEQYPGVPTSQLLISWSMQNGKSIGFSLDPKLRAKEAARELGKLIEASGSPARLAALLHGWNVDPEVAAALVLAVEKMGFLPLTHKDLSRALQRELAARSDVEALGALTKARFQYDSPEQLFVALAASMLSEHSGYQCARYDGPLQGTLTGMTMFYTDLLMKLWTIDQFDSAPEGLIPGFESVPGHELSSAYCTADEGQYPATRAWLGLREEQYVRQSADRVRLAPVVTRVFARGSQYGSEYGAEVEASAAMRRFYRWWNARYAQVAAWEPQYELLNQIMKWSVVTQTAGLSEHQDCLDFLDQIPVDRDQRFDQWVAGHKELRWRGPVSLVHRDEPTECIPLLRSRRFSMCGDRQILIGGVTAASRATVAGKRVVPPSRSPQLGRLDSTSSTKPWVSPYDGRVEYDAIVRPDGTLRKVDLDPAKRAFRARVDTGQSQRGTSHGYGLRRGGQQEPVTGLRNERSLQRRELAASDAIDAGGRTLGVAHLHADDVTAPMLRPQLTPGPATRMRTIGDEAATRLADGKTKLSDVAPDLPGVISAYRLPDERVLVELPGAAGGSPRYGVMSSSGGNRGPPGLLTGHFGAPGHHGARGTVEVSLLNDDAARAMRAQGTRLPSRQQATLHPITTALDDDDLLEADRALSLHVARGGDPALAVDVLAQAHRRAVAQGKDTSGIEALQLRTSIKHGKPRAPARELGVLPADGTDFLVPRSHVWGYTELASLPPGQTPVPRPGAPRPAFAARVVEESSTFSDVPGVVRVDGVDYIRLQRPWAMARGALRRAYIVEPCRRPGEDEGRATVECEGPTTARRAEEAQRQHLHRQACRFEKTAKEYAMTGCGKSPRP